LVDHQLAGCAEEGEEEKVEADLWVGGDEGEDVWKLTSDSSDR